MNTQSYILLGIILLIVGIIIFREIQNRRKGKSSCSGCSGCKSTPQTRVQLGTKKDVR